MAEELHISSLVVNSAVQHVQGVADAIAAIPGARVHGASLLGKLVVTLEAGTAAEMTAKVNGIEHTDGVLSAALVYHYSDTLEVMMEELPDADR